MRSVAYKRGNNSELSQRHGATAVCYFLKVDFAVLFDVLTIFADASHNFLSVNAVLEFDFHFERHEVNDGIFNAGSFFSFGLH